jgi:hypothetical protein
MNPEISEELRQWAETSKRDFYTRQRRCENVKALRENMKAAALFVVGAIAVLGCAKHW